MLRAWHRTVRNRDIRKPFNDFVDNVTPGMIPPGLDGHPWHHTSLPGRTLTSIPPIPCR